MASVVRNKQRRVYAVQWRDATGWRRKTVAHLPRGAAAFPKRDPPEVLAALIEYQRREDDAKTHRAADPGRTAARFLAAYRDYYVTARRPASVVQYDAACKWFLAWCGREKIALLSAVTPSACDRFVTARLKVVAPVSARREVGLLSGAWTRAVRLRDAAENPWRFVAVPGAVRRRTSSWTPDEFARLVRAAPAWLRDVLVLGCHTGLRANALTHLEWRDVRWNRGAGPGLGSVVVRPELDKAKTGYEVPMSGACHDLLARLSAGKAAGPLVLTTSTGLPIRSVSRLGERVHAAVRKAKLPKPDSPCHAMRRTFGRWAVLGTLTGRPVPVYVVSKWLGHKSIHMTEQYLDVSEQASQVWMAGPGEAGQTT